MLDETNRIRQDAMGAAYVPLQCSAAGNLVSQVWSAGQCDECAPSIPLSLHFTLHRLVRESSTGAVPM